MLIIHLGGDGGGVWAEECLGFSFEARPRNVAKTTTSQEEQVMLKENSQA